MNAFRLPLLAAALVAGAAHGQIVTDGRVGPAGAITPAGGNYAITNALGTQVGGNLFHSFSTFNLATSNVATFSGTAGTANIVARVTGGSGSSIDGTMRSTIAGANLWFINPWGVTFGPNAQLDVSGAFHASTAAYLKLGGGPGRFDAVNPGASNLTTAAPSAFGFLGTPAPLTVNNALLAVQDGQTLSLVGGKLTLNTAALGARGGRINLASAAGAGEIALGTGITSTSGMALGEIRIAGGGLTTESPSASAMDSGPVYIRGGMLTLESNAVILSRVGAANSSSGNGGNIDIALTGTLEMSGGSILAGVYRAGAIGQNAGSITIAAGSASVSGGIIDASVPGLGSDGDGGNISIASPGAVTFSNNALLRSESVFGSGAAGNLSIAAGSLTVDDSRLVASTAGAGSAGQVQLNVGTLNLSNGGRVEANAEFNTATVPGFGQGGSIVVNATGAVDISGAGSGLFSSTTGYGDGGSIAVNAASIRVASGGRIAAESTDPFMISGLFSPSGDSGSISLNASGSVIIDGGAISTFSETAGAGPISIRAVDTVLVRNGSISTATQAATLGNSAGAITIDPIFVILDNGSITTTAVVDNGGPVTITTQFFMMSPGSVIDTSSTFGQAGTLTINSPNTDTVSELGALPAGYFDASALLRESCAARAGRGANSFVGVGRGGLPAGPGAVAFANYTIPAAKAAAAPQSLLYASACPSGV